MAARARVAVFEQVFPAQLGGRHAQLFGQLVERVFERKDGLRRAEPAHGTRVRVVGQHAGGVVIQVVIAVRPRPERRRLVHDRRGHVDVAARVADRLDLHGLERAILHGADLQVKLDRMALVGLADGLLPRQGILGRAAGLERHEAGAHRNGLGAFDFAAERPAYDAGPHDDLRHGDVQHAADGNAGVVGRLQGAQYRHLPAHAARDGRDRLRLDVGVLHKAGLVIPLDDDIRLGKALFHIALERVDIAANVVRIVGIDDLLVADGLAR